MIYFVRVVGVMKGLWCFCIGYSESFRVWVVVREVRIKAGYKLQFEEGDELKNYLFCM